MDIPATSDNIPGTVVLRDNTGDCSVGDLRVNGNLQIGGSNSSNFISFRGTAGDDQTPFTHSFVGERIYSPEESSELLVCKGNDPEGHPAGPDRIRLAAARLTFDTYPPGQFIFGTFDQMGASAAPVTRLTVKGSGQVRFTPLSADPANAEAGDVYYNSSSNKLKVYNGTSWVDLH